MDAKVAASQIVVSIVTPPTSDDERTNLEAVRSSPGRHQQQQQKRHYASDSDSQLDDDDEEQPLILSQGKLSQSPKKRSRLRRGADTTTSSSSKRKRGSKLVNNKSRVASKRTSRMSVAKRSLQRSHSPSRYFDTEASYSSEEEHLHLDENSSAEDLDRDLSSFIADGSFDDDEDSSVNMQAVYAQSLLNDDFQPPRPNPRLELGNRRREPIRPPLHELVSPWTATTQATAPGNPFVRAASK